MLSIILICKTKITKGISGSKPIVVRSCWVALITYKEPYACARLTEVRSGVQPCWLVSLTSFQQLHCPGFHNVKTCSHSSEDMIYSLKKFVWRCLLCYSYLTDNESSLLIRMTKLWWWGSNATASTTTWTHKKTLKVPLSTQHGKNRGDNTHTYTHSYIF